MISVFPNEKGGQLVADEKLKTSSQLHVCAMCLLVYGLWSITLWFVFVACGFHFQLHLCRIFVITEKKNYNNVLHFIFHYFGLIKNKILFHFSPFLSSSFPSDRDMLHSFYFISMSRGAAI